MLGGQSGDQGPTHGRQGALLNYQIVGYRPAGRSHPVAERGDELVAGDHGVLKRKQSEEKMAVGGHRGAPGHGVVPIETHHGNGARSRGERRDGTIIA